MQYIYNVDVVHFILLFNDAFRNIMGSNDHNYELNILHKYIPV